MNYDIESIKKRNAKITKIKLITQRIAFALTIILIYNVFLVVTSNTNNNKARELFNYKAFIITTESMKPNINKGDIVIVLKCEEQDLKVGNIVTFTKNGETITHRIIEIRETGIEKEYVTKGDNNNIEDSEKIKYEQIEGIQSITIPFLGNIINIFRNKLFIVLLILLAFIAYLFITRKEEKKEIRREKKKIEDKKFKDNTK